ncbi:MAG: thioredoxin family protein [Anaerolineae bacterium]|nr:thioredoxin family protein [Anaerolineae bacterium]MCO5187970.1 thioredoxin family protein [Anaerolineae bacterium]MCO5195311.1 thioredoxin family protein [Anaerolineae bacterium]MCO5198640.1 thioredoxin family protein [Anaerolineae bacterium]MCO5207546.1 thioredoxin family protein [Anaerolineae bacterium]
MITVKVLGPGCANCKRLDQMTRKVADDMQLDVSIEKVTDYGEIMTYGIMSTPGLVVDGRVVSYGRIPSQGEISTWLADAALATA